MGLAHELDLIVSEQAPPRRSPLAAPLVAPPRFSARARPSPAKPEEPAPRLFALDVFRGLTVAGMILVNSPGSADSYRWLAHALWQGVTPADIVFPSFLVVCGASLAIAMTRGAAKGLTPRVLLPQVLRRSALLFGLGMVTNLFMFQMLQWPGGLRLTGVLQRIAVCYLAGSLLFLAGGPLTEALCAALLLAGYWLLLTRVPVPGFGPGVLTPAGNLASFIDRRLMPGRLSGGASDPEGILSTIPAIANVLMGSLAGRWLLSGRAERSRTIALLIAGAALACAGLFWGRWFMLNKEIWTSSYALFAGGLALAGLALVAAGAEVPGMRILAKPFEIFGQNSLLAYFLSGLFYRLIDLAKMPVDGVAGNLRLWLVARVFSPWLTPAAASLAYSLTFTLFCLAVMAFLHHRKIFLRL